MARTRKINDHKEIVLTDEIVNVAPIAQGAVVFLCSSPACKQPHIMLLDADSEPLAQYVVGPGFFAELEHAMKKASQ